MQNEQQPPAPADPTGNWNFTGGGTDDLGGTAAQTAAPPAEQSVDWTASEFIAHTKSAGWYALLIAVGFGLAILIFAISKGIFVPIIIVIVTVLFAIMAARKPRELPYRIDTTGIHIGQKHYAYGQFKSFSLVQEGGVESIWLLPLQRFAPGLSIYFAPEDRDRILEILDDYLPVEERQLDMVDRLMHKIRF